jgi:hypothetical protein
VRVAARCDQIKADGVVCAGTEQRRAAAAVEEKRREREVKISFVFGGSVPRSNLCPPLIFQP